jgi:hypothetical protein
MHEYRLSRLPDRIFLNSSALLPPALVMVSCDCECPISLQERNMSGKPSINCAFVVSDSSVIRLLMG